MKSTILSCFAALLFLSIGSDIGMAQQKEVYAMISGNAAVFKLPSGFQLKNMIEFRSHVKKTATDERLLRIQIPETSSLDEAISFLKGINDIVWVEEVIPYQILENTLLSTPNDPSRSSLQPWLETVKAYQAWDIGTGSSDVIISVIDTGTEISHEDLAANVWVNSDEIPNNGIDDDANGYVDDVNGWDFYENNGNPSPKSTSNNHGTHVAGIASAVTNNGKGISAISYNTRFMPLKISDNNGKNLSYGVESIVYAVDNGAKVINCSWGSTRISKALEVAVNYAWENGVIVVAAAGNDGTDNVYYPAGFPNVIAVASVGYKNLVKSTYSNYGGFVDVVAPGGDETEGIYSTLVNNKYGASSGTSMASPVVASLVGLMRSVRTDWDVATVRTQLETTCLSVNAANSDFSYRLGSGLIQANLALSTTLKPLAKLISFDFGDPNAVSAVFNRGEEFELYLHVLNLGINQSAIKVTAIPINDVITIESGNNLTYSANHLSSFDAQAIRIRVREDVSVNTKALLRIQLSYSDNSTSNEIISIQLVPDNLIHNVNTIELGVNGTGRIGYFTYPSTNDGSGFVIKPNGTTESALINIPLLREAGLTFGSSETRISSAVRGAGSTINDEFYLIDYFQSEFNSSKGFQKGSATFTDLNAGIEGVRFDLVTTLESFAQTSDEDANYILLKYTLENASDITYSAIRAGLFFDFDMPFTESTNDVVFYDVQDDFVAQFGGGTESDTTLYVGASIVEGIYTPWLINNNETDSNPFFGVTANSGGNGFSDAEKWRSMSMRTASAAAFDQRRRMGPANVSFMISPNAFSFDKGTKHEFTVVLAYGIGLSQLRSTIQRAKSRASLVTSLDHDLSNSIEIPKGLQLIRAFPNPFNPQTSITFSTTERGIINLEVFDVVGRVVFSTKLMNPILGEQSVQLNASGWSSGVYIVRLRQNKQFRMLPITFVK